MPGTRHYRRSCFRRVFEPLQRRRGDLDILLGRTGIGESG